MSEWISIKEKLPKTNEDILICDKYGDIFITHRATCNEYYTESGNRIKAVKAWMPLPQPYKAESEDKE